MTKSNFNKSYIKKDEVVRLINQNTGGGGGAVNSVFGRSGAVISQTSDYDSIQVDFSPVGTLLATNAQGAIEELDNNITNIIVDAGTF
jgi:hypothetical protein